MNEYRLVVTVTGGFQFNTKVRSIANAKSRAVDMAVSGAWEEKEDGTLVFHPAHRVISIAVEPEPS